MNRSHGFSLVEIIVALGIVAFALLSIFALLPIGMRSNKVSLEETRATAMLTLLEADLRNTHPSANAGKSLLFGLTLPYASNGSGQRIVNTTLAANTISADYSTGVQDNETTVSYAANPPPRYQTSVIYQAAPAAGSLEAIQARLIINWPAQNAASPTQLVSTPGAGGFVETYVTFPAP